MRSFFGILVFLVVSGVSFCQDFLSLNDLSDFKAEELTESQIDQINSEIDKKNISLNDVRLVALEKGMPSHEYDLLVQRLESTLSSGSKKETEIWNKKPVVAKKTNDRPNKTKNDSLSWVFGSEIFSNSSLSFEPNQSLSTPDAYVLGAGDELQVVIYGVQQFTQSALVNKEGKIFLNNIGTIHVGGLQLGAATELIKSKASAIYSTLKAGRSELSITLSGFKTIQVTMIGVKQPGNYSLSSLGTVFNALYSSGGPADNGSYRNIELIRNNKVVMIIDLYDFLTKGSLSSNVGLQNDDIIRVPIYEKRVEITGEVKREGLFELKNGEGLSDLLRYCSGFSDSAYVKSLQLKTTTDSERKIRTISNEEFDSIEFKSGDAVHIGKLRNSFENKVTISGAVYRPSEYELTEGMTLYDLIVQSDGLTEDAFKQRALLMRKGDQLMPEIIGVDLREILSNAASSENVKLRRDDELIVNSVLSLTEEHMVSISGEVLSPGIFPYVGNLTLYDLIIQAGGLKESASNKVEIASIIVSDSSSMSDSEAEVRTIEIDQNFKSLAENIELRPFDVISIRKMQEYRLTKTVSVQGELNYPGTYVITSGGESVLDIIERAGGMGIRANFNGVKILRESINGNRVLIPISYKKIKKHPKSKSNVTVREGDVIIVEKLIQTTQVSGAVALQTEIPVNVRRHAKYYIRSAGGFNENANKKKTYVIYANGVAKSTRNFGLFKIYPRPEFGSTIVVPGKEEKINEMSTQEVVALSGVLSSITGVTIAIISLLKP